MKRIVLVAASLFAASSSFAGVMYDFRSESTGVQQVTIEGTIAVEGPNFRMSMAHGDGMMFKDGSILLSRDGGKTVAVYDPSARTYFDMPFDAMGDLSAILKSAMVKLSFDNPVVNVNDGGDGGTVEGFPTQKSILDAKIDINIEVMGQTMTSKMSMHSESWTTDKVPAAALNIFQQRSMTTGIEGLDKLVAAQAAYLKGRFPIKQVTTVHLIQNEHDITTVNTSTVSNVKQKTLEPSVFAAPEGYRRVDNPIEAMKKRPVG